MVSSKASKPLSLTWDLLYVPIILATIALTVALWPSMPDQIPVHAGIDGTVNRWASKSNLLEVGFPVLAQIFMAAVMVVCHGATLKTRAQAKTARLESVLLLGIGLALTAGIGTIVFAFAGFMSLNDFAVLMLVIAGVILVTIIGALIWAFKSGDTLCDAGDWWRGGIFYYAPEDPRILVSKRFGLGWTLNYGNWRSWLITIGFLALVIGLVVLCAVTSS